MLEEQNNTDTGGGAPTETEGDTGGEQTPETPTPEPPVADSPTPEAPTE
jgi:hypothetical protein